MELPYKVWTEEEIKSRNIFEEGNYPFCIVNATMKQTRVKLDERGQPKPTYPMLELDLEIHDKNGVVRLAKDWIVFMEGMDWKLNHLADTVGLLHLYEAGKLTDDNLISKQGVLSLGVRESEYNGQTRKQNFVIDYVKRERVDLTLNDDIPL